MRKEKDVKQKQKYTLTRAEERAIAKENRRAMKHFEALKARKNVKESEYLTKMHDPNNIVEFDNLHTYFYTDAGVVKAVDGVSFDIPRGSTVCVVGESGCGKSVTSLSLMQLVQAPQGQITAGEIRYNAGDKAYNVAKMPTEAMRKIRGKDITMIFQEPMTSLNPIFTIGNQLDEVSALHLGFDKQQAKEKSIEMLDLVGIARAAEVYKCYPHELSGGMRQRVMIAIALACRPHLLIADEPTTALDVTIQAQIMELIVRLNEQLNMGVMLITHDLAVVAQTCSRVIVMYLGQIVEEADVLTLFDHPCHPYTEGLMRSIPRMEGDRTKPLYMIPGTVPLLSQIPTGCRFAPRCAYATERCRQETPQLTPVSDKQSVRCFRAAELAQKEATAQ